MSTAWLKTHAYRCTCRPEAVIEGICTTENYKLWDKLGSYAEKRAGNAPKAKTIEDSTTQEKRRVVAQGVLLHVEGVRSIYSSHAPTTYTTTEATLRLCNTFDTSNRLSFLFPQIPPTPLPIACFPTLLRCTHIKTHQTGHKTRQTRRHQGDNPNIFAPLSSHPCFLPLLYFIIHVSFKAS